MTDFEVTKPNELTELKEKYEKLLQFTKKVNGVYSVKMLPEDERLMLLAMQLKAHRLLEEIGES